MRAAVRPLKFAVLAGLLALFLVPTTALTQFGPPGGGFPGGGGGPPGGFPGGGMGRGGRGGMGGGMGRGMGGGGFNRDPNERWNEMTGGKDVWRRSEITDPGQQQRFDFMARMVGSSNGEITKEQYMGMTQRFQAMRATGGGGFGRPGGFGPPGGAPGGAPTPGQAAPATPGAPAAPGGGGGAMNPAAFFEQMIEARFRSYDTNGDGLLNNDEMPEALRAERDRWDTNKDGFISLEEFKEYARGRVQEMRAERGNQGWGGWGGQGAQPPGGEQPTPQLPLEEEEDKPQPVYRAANLPKELPAWFKEADADGDAQIGLYEWKAKGWDIAEFQKMDRNNDGFLTVDEVLHYQKQQQEVAGGPGTTPGSTAAPGGPPGGMPPGMAGRPGGFGRGPGGFPGGGGFGGGGFGRGQGGGGFPGGGGFGGGGFPRGPRQRRAMN
jgi:Ca2+-binding EF-hand superfamily protein